MPDGRRATCRVCGKHRDEAGPISWTGKCGECGPRLNREAAESLRDHRGEIFTRWRRGMAASVGVKLVDDNEGT